MKEIEMIASYDLEGHIRPFRFRLAAEDESLLVVNIDRVLFNEENKRDNTIKYRCECMIQERKRNVDIFYNKVKMKWHLKI